MLFLSIFITLCVLFKKYLDTIQKMTEIKLFSRNRMWLEKVPSIQIGVKSDNTEGSMRCNWRVI